mgnify:CR=1 FL=1
MSYCRWSTDDFLCDLYCYEDVSGGWTTHVAGLKRVYTRPLPPDVPWPKPDPGQDDAWWELFWARYKAMNEFEEGNGYGMVPIGLPCDGQSFNDPDLQSFRERVVSLRAMGYRCPDSVLEKIDEEIAEESAEPQP